MNEAPINNSIWFWQDSSAGPRFPPPIILLVYSPVIEILGKQLNLRYLGIRKLTVLNELQVWFMSQSKEERFNSQKQSYAFTT